MANHLAKLSKPAIPKQAAKTLDLQVVVDTRVLCSPTKNHPQQVDADAE